MPSFQVDHAALLVRSLERSLPFYRALLPLLGLCEGPACSWTSSAGFTVKLGEAAPRTNPYDRFAPGLNHLAFAAPDEAALKAVSAGMTDAGFEVPMPVSFGRATALFLSDPDGLRVEVSHEPR